MKSSIGSPGRPPGISGRFTVCIVEMFTTAGMTSLTMSAKEGGGSAERTDRGSAQQIANSTVHGSQAEPFLNVETSLLSRRARHAKERRYESDSGIHQAWKNRTFRRARTR